MFENIIKFFKNIGKKESTKESSDTAKERLHLVLMQDRANVSADFLELMKQEIIEVIKKYIDVDEKAIDVRLTNKSNEDGTVGAPALYANIPITTIKNEARKVNVASEKVEEQKEESINKVSKEEEKVKTEKEEEKTSKASNQEKEVEQEEKTDKKKAEKEEDKPEAKKIISKAKTAPKTQKAKTTKTKAKKEEGEKVKEVAKKK